MRQRAAVLTLLAAAAACSERNTTSTEARPEFAIEPVPCTTAPTLTPPAAITVPANSSGTSRFWLLKNNCSSTSGPWDFFAARTGAVASVGPASPQFVTMVGGGTAKIAVPFTTGAVGTGTISLTATRDQPAMTVTRSQSVNVTAAVAGVPFGPADLFNATGGLRQLAPFTWTGDYMDPGSIIGQITTARSNHIKLSLVMTGGGSGNYVTNGKFDYAGKWVPRQKAFDTPEIKSAVAAGVSDGTILFATLIDEPNRSDWGGNVHHSTLDSMSRYVKSIFPTLRTGVDVTHTWENTLVYQSVDVITTQYAGTEKSGDTTTYRTQAVSSANTQNVGLFFSINILNGGKKPVAGTNPCPTSTTGGLGTTESGVLKGCKMTGTEVQSYGDALLVATEACGLKMWTYDLTTWTPTGDFMTVNRPAFDHLAATAGAHAARACVKPR